MRVLILNFTKLFHNRWIVFENYKWLITRIWYLFSYVLQMGLIFFYMFLLCSTQLRAEKINKYVTTLINAKWNETPLILEAAEYLSDENPSFFWKFVDAFSNKINNFVIGDYLVLFWKHLLCTIVAKLMDLLISISLIYCL